MKPNISPRQRVADRSPQLAAAADRASGQPMLAAQDAGLRPIRQKIAFFDFASGEGCQLAILNVEDALLDLVDLVDLVEFREALSERYDRSSWSLRPDRPGRRRGTDPWP